ncbi:MAG: O-antigen ligase family protein [Gemmatimonadaceae bacterium]|nr:O-antigen ligase family protein [Gemmatimonadaceae bacterium]
MAQAVSPPMRARVALALLVLGALTTVLLALPYRSFDLDRFLAPKELAMEVAAAAALLALVARRGARVAPAETAMLVVLAATAVGAVLATNGPLAARAATMTLASFTCFVVAREVARAGMGRGLVVCLAAVTVIGAMTALVQAYGVEFELASMSRAPGGTFGNRNFMAHLAAAGIPLLLIGAVRARHLTSATLHALGVAINAAALVLSRTRAAWLALALFVALVAVASVRSGAVFRTARTLKRLILLAVAAVGGVVGALYLPNSLDWKSDNPYLDSMRGVVNYKDGSGGGRLKQYANSAKLFLGSPVVGVGAGNWPVRYPGVAPRNDPSLDRSSGMTSNPWPSSDWVAMLSERGVLAFVGWAGLMIMLFSTGMARWWDVDGALDARLDALALAGLVTVVAAEGAFDAVLLLPMTGATFWAAAGALYASGDESEPSAPSTMRPALIIAATLLLIGGAALSLGRVRAMALYTRGTTTALEQAVAFDPGGYRVRMRLASLYASQGRCPQVRIHAGRAAELFPLAGAPKALLARCR